MSMQDKYKNVGIVGSIRLAETGQEISLSFAPGEKSKAITLVIDDKVLETELVLLSLNVGEGLCNLLPQIKVPEDLKFTPSVVKETPAADTDAKPDEAKGTEPETPVEQLSEELPVEEFVQANIPLTSAPQPTPVSEEPTSTKGKHVRRK